MGWWLLRASLVSATSVIALLLLEGGKAVAGPVIDTSAPPPFYHVLGTTASAGYDPATPGTAAATDAFASLTTGAASTTDGDTGSMPYFAVGQSVLARLADAAPPNGEVNPTSVRKTLGSGAATGTGNSVFVGTSANRALLDSPVNLLSAASASFGYTIAPAGKGANGVSPSTAPARNLPGQTNPEGAPAAAGGLPEPAATAERLDVPAGGATTNAGADGSAYTYTPLRRGTGKAALAPRLGTGNTGADFSQTMTVAPKGQASGSPTSSGPATGRGFAVSVPGGSVFIARQVNADRSAGPRPSRMTPNATNSALVKAFYSVLQQAGSDTTQSNKTLTSEGYKTAEADPLDFTISSPSDGPSAIHVATVALPIKVVSSGSGELPSSLMIFMPASTTSDEAGDPLSYFFNRGIVQ
jgi:hypothetical protein